MNKKTGFTLAEVLITLVIIGIIAAMTVPTLMTNTNSQEYRSALKKSIASLNQALTMQYALDGTQITDFSTSATNVRDSVMVKRLNVLQTANTGSFGVSGTTWTTPVVFYTADGVKFGINTTSAGTCLADGSTPCYTVYIDVNGDKKPNTATSVVTKPLDVYSAMMYSQRVIPQGPIAQGVMYDQ